MNVNVFIIVMFFFFKQKTAYDMRISDWSSDVCSSDLWGCRRGDDEGRVRPSRRDGADPVAELRQCRGVGRDAGLVAELCLASRSRRLLAPAGSGAARSEEHTSDLQSIMRTSHSVFCLQKTKRHSYNFSS